MMKRKKFLSLTLCLILLLGIFTACESEEEKAKKYVDDVTLYSSEYATAVREFNAEWKKADFDNPAWRSTVTEKIENIEISTKKLSSLSPPRAYNASQDKINDGAMKINTAMSSFKEIVNNSKSSSDAIQYQEDLIKNVSLLSEASDLFNDASILVYNSEL